jgi:hypothetical protein
VPLLARDLIAFHHMGTRKFLENAGTMVSMAAPVGAARTIAGKVALVALEKVIPLVIVLVDENRLNLVKWFPTWGPRMLYFCDVAKVLVGIYGVGQFLRSGAQFVSAWRQVRNSRALLEGAAEVPAEAERVAAALERQADEVFVQAAAFEQAEGAAAKTAATTPAPSAPEPSGVPTTPEAPSTTLGATPEPPVATTVDEAAAVGKSTQTSEQLAEAAAGKAAAASKAAKTIDRLAIDTIGDLTDAEKSALTQLDESAWDRVLAYATGNQNVHSVKGKIAEELFELAPEFETAFQRALAQAAKENIPPESVRFVRDIRGIAPTQKAAGTFAELADGAIVSVVGDRVRILAVFESKSPSNLRELARRPGEVLGQVGWDFERFTENAVSIDGTVFAPEKVLISRRATQWLGIAPPESSLTAGQLEAIRAGLPGFELFQGLVRDSVLNTVATRVIGLLPKAP